MKILFVLFGLFLYAQCSTMYGFRKEPSGIYSYSPYQIRNGDVKSYYLPYGTVITEQPGRVRDGGKCGCDRSQTMDIKSINREVVRVQNSQPATTPVVQPTKQPVSQPPLIKAQNKPIVITATVVPKPDTPLQRPVESQPVRVTQEQIPPVELLQQPPIQTPIQTPVQPQPSIVSQNPIVIQSTSPVAEKPLNNPPKQLGPLPVNSNPTTDLQVVEPVAPVQPVDFPQPVSLNVLPTQTAFLSTNTVVSQGQSKIGLNGQKVIANGGVSVSNPNTFVKAAPPNFQISQPTRPTIQQVGQSLPNLAPTVIGTSLGGAVTANAIRISGQGRVTSPGAIAISRP